MRVVCLSGLGRGVHLTSRCTYETQNPRHGTVPRAQPASDSRHLSRLSQKPKRPAPTAIRKKAPPVTHLPHPIRGGGRMTPPSPPAGPGPGTTADSSKLPSFNHCKTFFSPSSHTFFPSGPRLSSRATPSYHLLAWSHSLTLARPHPPYLARRSASTSSLPLTAPLFGQVLLSLTYLLKTPVSCSPRSAHIEQPSPNPPQIRTCPAPGHRSRPTSSTFRHRA